MKVDLEYLEKLSKLEIGDADKEQFAKDFERILDFVDEITKLELSDEDRIVAVPLAELREDEEGSKEHCDVIANAPKKKDGCYVTPLVVE